MFGNPLYGILMLAGIALSAALWGRFKRTAQIPALVFIGGLIGGVLGAKIGYWLLELPFHAQDPNFWPNVLVGRTILGGLLGGYLGVEWGKRMSDYRAPTGDLFACVVPLGIALGRVGCHLSGCCLGKECGPAWYAVADAHGVWRWPAPLAEAGFNLLFAGFAGIAYRRQIRALRGQLFHVYLIGYGLFRFVHEFFRDTPRIGGVSPYQVLALVIVVFAAWRFQARRRELFAPEIIARA